MPPANAVQCMLCGREAPPLAMSPAGAPVLGHHLDFALAVRWFCPEPCFETYKHSPRLRERVRQFQDAAATWARACVANVSDEALREMEALPEGLRVDAAERERARELANHLDDVTALQDFNANHLLHRICRNINRNPFYHPTEHQLVSYDELKLRLGKLEAR